MLTDFTIRNFRGIKELTLPSLKRVNLFVGKNGVGKTSVLEAIWLAARAMDPSAISWVLHERNEPQSSGSIHKAIESLFHDLAEPKKLEVGPQAYPRGLKLKSWSRDSSAPYVGGTLEVHLRLDDTGTNWVWESIPPDALSQRPLPTFGFDHRAIFLPANGYSDAQLQQLWADLGSSRASAVSDSLKPLVPDLQEVIVRTTGDQRVPIVRFLNNNTAPLRRYGDGAVRRFMLAVAMQSAAGGILVMDEIENGIHYTVQQEVWNLILNWSSGLDVQVFATTHSRDAVYALAEASNQDDHIAYRLEHFRGKLQAIAMDSSDLDVLREASLEIR